VYRYWEQVRHARVVDDVPTRLVGGSLLADAESPGLLPAPGPRLIVPGEAASERRRVPGGIPILRGGVGSLRDG
jgi:hypothetical protein